MGAVGGKGVGRGGLHGFVRSIVGFWTHRKTFVLFLRGYLEVWAGRFPVRPLG